MLKNWKIETP
uniref:Uncharacterized protein n=1 Tax=Rhizophora mucronata TaxID=61149 RepID=A0A2P2Q9I9_RHIMU